MTLPLEKFFERKAKADQSAFPVMTLDYTVQYHGFVNHLRAHFYPGIDAGLAANSAEHGFYTAHDGNHFDEVVRFAGKLLGITTGEEDLELINLTAYEIYILLMAIRIHDVGNIEGREKHERKIFKILKDCGAVAGADDIEKKIIAKIAQAHGGKTATGSKDTIGEIPVQEPAGPEFIRPQLLASIVRFADEICENRNRAANYLMEQGALPKHSELFHVYAASIRGNVVSSTDRRITLHYLIKIDDVGKLWGCATTGDKTEDYLINTIIDRLQKMDRERRYCNRFSKDIYTVDSIRAVIEIIDENHETVEQISVPELRDAGYPEDDPHKLMEKLKEYCGPEFAKKLAERVAP